MQTTTRIVIETSAGHILLQPTPENFAVAAAFADQPLYCTNGEWAEDKITYAVRGGEPIKIKVQRVRIVDAEQQLTEQRMKAEEARWRAEADKTKAEKAKSETQKALDSAVEEIKRLTQAAEAAQQQFEKSFEQTPKAPE